MCAVVVSTASEYTGKSPGDPACWPGVSSIGALPDSVLVGAGIKDLAIGGIQRQRPYRLRRHCRLPEEDPLLKRSRPRKPRTLVRACGTTSGLFGPPHGRPIGPS